MDDKRPAVNLRSLAELFFANIEKRILTRYDLNFDPTLTLGREHLKDEVRAAIQAQDESYWNACTEELAKIIEHQKIRGSPDYDILFVPDLVEILGTAVGMVAAQEDSEALKEAFDSSLLIQQLLKGVWEPKGLLALLLVLTSGCDPARQTKLSEIGLLFTKGHHRDGLADVVCGLRQLLQVLEDICVDRANKFLDENRPRLIGSTVLFMQEAFAEAPPCLQKEFERSVPWYRTIQWVFNPQADPKKLLFAFMEGLSRLVLPSSEEDFPSTFVADYERLSRIRGSLLVLVAFRTFDQFRKAMTGLPLLPNIDDEGLSSLCNKLLGAARATTSNVNDLAENTSELLSMILECFFGTSPSECQLKVDPRMFEDMEQEYHEKLLRHLRQKTEYYRERPLIELHIGLAAQTPVCRRQDLDTSARVESMLNVAFDKVVNVVTHVGILHWRVWGDYYEIMGGGRHGTNYARWWFPSRGADTSAACDREPSNI